MGMFKDNRTKTGYSYIDEGRGADGEPVKSYRDWTPEERKEFYLGLIGRYLKVVSKVPDIDLRAEVAAVVEKVLAPEPESEE